MAQTAKTEADKAVDTAKDATSNVADLGRRTSDKAVDWDRVVHIHTEYLRVSLERTARLTQRYFEVSQAVLLSATSTVQRQLDKAA
jgi:hypothetical protein